MGNTIFINYNTFTPYLANEKVKKAGLYIGRVLTAIQAFVIKLTTPSAAELQARNFIKHLSGLTGEEGSPIIGKVATLIYKERSLGRCIVPR